MSFVRSSCIAACVVVASASAGTAHAATFSFEVLDHPDGNAAPPTYAFRLDNSFGISGVHTFTAIEEATPFDGLSLTLDLDGMNSTVTIAGEVLSNEDGMVYDLFFEYTAGVSAVTADGFVITGTAGHSGYIQKDDDLSTRIDLTSKTKNMYGFSDLALFFGRPGRLDLNQYAGDGFTEDDFSVEGWVMGDDGNSGTRDFLFVARQTGGGDLPTPGAGALVALAGLVGLRRRR